MGEPIFIAETFVNSFHYLAQDADYFRGLAKSAQGFDRVRISRTAVLLYVFSMEALINRCMDEFLPPAERDFFLQREKKLSPLDKFELVPLLVTGKTFDKSTVVWAKLNELFALRNDYVHPKHDRAAYVKFLDQRRVEPLTPAEIPGDSALQGKMVEYANLKVPKDPYSVLPEHLDRVKEAAGEVLQALNTMLQGRVLKDSWHTKDQMKLIYPPGATWADLAPGPLEVIPPLRAGSTEYE